MLGDILIYLVILVGFTYIFAIAFFMTFGINLASVEVWAKYWDRFRGLFRRDK
jgi:hypothetical protein